MKPVVLIILDGWGLAPPGPGNAIRLAKLPNFQRLWNSYPHAELSASGESVGLPQGEDGNTETGHINLGAGRVVYQDLPRINMAVSDGSFAQNEAFLGAVNYVNSHSSRLHIMGVVSDAGVHASRNHLYALLTLLSRMTTKPPVLLHLFTDGRDAPPKSAARFVSEVETFVEMNKVGSIATIIGRYYAMDRDRRWERTKRAYQALTEVSGTLTARDSKAAIEQAYRKGQTDEFIEPTILLDSLGKPLPRISNHDSVIFINFRIDRPRQLTRAFVLADFESQGASYSYDPYSVKYYHKHVVEPDTRQKPFKRHIVLPNLFFVTMTEYERHLPCTVAFPPQLVLNPLGKVYADNRHRQLRASESEKERFVGYYFNGLREDPFPGEDHIIIPSPKVATYDLAPEMSSFELTQHLVDRLGARVYSFILVNFANPDMVGHTGNIAAAIRACEVTDQHLGTIVPAVLAIGGTCIITADHGNVEEMLGPDGSMDTEHSTFAVPFLFINRMFESRPMILPRGTLADVAPTVLSFQKLPIPQEMTGTNLLV